MKQEIIATAKHWPISSLKNRIAAVIGSSMSGVRLVCIRRAAVRLWQLLEMRKLSQLLSFHFNMRASARAGVCVTRSVQEWAGICAGVLAKVRGSAGECMGVHTHMCSGVHGNRQENDKNRCLSVVPVHNSGAPTNRRVKNVHNTMEMHGNHSWNNSN